ncbi:MAG: aminomethyl-transferring glycine dehydrogenase subunit GcvPA [Bacteroidales bacterium]|jgi:glycine dehydrogenase subunit 1|nr:aminomethyl-transferring glycine dehydrogenase subunit GcvPA [Bacteroidales bacterium]MBQ5411569.1 aminomethyl-transferring glycine dehydrogenase subunit GcvPA [Bacteroidales bacterium]MEE3475914.1 aminomethyl-transferring glycine dehydrogenase subunit GcvPA [Candidatus Cryptobacteroides sp.]
MATFQYFPHTGDDVRKMLERVGAGSIDDLYSDVPQDVIYKGEYDLPDAMSEQEVRDFFESLDEKDSKLKVFVGQGSYDHYTPSVIPYITSRSEFLTAYTPYQAEISQGTLRYIFEYQSMICALTGLDVSNASMYDGPTAAAEAVRMSLACTRKKSRVLVSRTLLPNVIRTIETYSKYSGIELGYLPVMDGHTCQHHMKAELSKGDVAGVIVPSVNRFGIIEDLTGYADAIHEAGAVFIEYCDPSALAVLKTPAEWGADIAVGDGQSLGIPMQFGGPYVGFMACRKDHLRKLPGRIVGETRDTEGRRVFCLTLQAREQHIRREKATSNICSNESLMALFVTVYASLMGPQGLKEVNDRSYAAAHYLHDELLKTGKFEEVYDQPFLKEFVLKPLTDVPALQQKLLDGGFFAALQDEDGNVTFCATEKRTKAQIDELVALVKEA